VEAPLGFRPAVSELVTMRIVQAHHFYRSSVPSGENRVVERECELLKRGGSELITLWRRSDDLLKQGLLTRIALAADLHAGEQRLHELTNILGLVQAEVLHAHNVWPSFSYGLFTAAKRAGLPTVQTLHNYRLIATNDHFFGAQGKKRPRSRLERAHLTRMPAMHGAIANRLYNRVLERYWREGVPQNDVDAYICLSRFQKDVMAEAGLPADKLVVKPNFLAHDGPIGEGAGAFALFVGRLSAEKGVEELARAWPATRLPLKIIGEGPLRQRLGGNNIEVLGPLPQADVQRLMARARFLVMNSQWYEGQPLVVIEAFASALPCLVPRLGSMMELVDEGRTGSLFDPERPEDLVAQAQRLWDIAPSLRAACRGQYEQCYTPAANLRAILRIYANIAAQRRPDDGVADIFGTSGNGMVGTWEQQSVEVSS
jgi:glycosyltransferase involved in cell wall biosynthesis